MPQSLWDKGERSARKFHPYDDELIWVQTALLVADAFTKSMTPRYLKRVLRECMLHVATV